MENVNRWYFTKEELASTPSRKSGIDANKELSYRQQAANFIQDMGQRLQVTQLCINTAIVYMHRFYVFHSFSEVHRNSLSVAALFLAAKVEEQPRKLEHVIKVAHVCLHKDSPPLDIRTEAYAEKQFEVVAHENVLLQTLGFVLAIEHPHTYVVKVCQLVKASKELAQTSYFMATTSLHMTTMCLQYRPTVVACVCIHLACKWSSWKIEPCSEGKEWYYYVDKSVTLDLLETLTQEFIAILETSPTKFKKVSRFTAQKEGCNLGSKSSVEYNIKQQMAESKFSNVKKETFSPGPSTSSISFNLCHQIEEKPVPAVKTEKVDKTPVQPPTQPPLPPPQPSQVLSPKKNKIASHSISIDAYREKKEKERVEQKPIELPEPQLLQPVVIKQEPGLSEPEKVHKEILNCLEHSHREKINKSSIHPKVEPLHSDKINNQSVKPKSLELLDIKEKNTKVKSGSSLKISSGVSNDPVVVLERVDIKTEIKTEVPDHCDDEPAHLTPQPVVVSTSREHKLLGENVCSVKDLPPASNVASISPIAKLKHPKHKTNSLHNSHTSAQSIPRKLSPIRDLKTNGSKETDPNTIVENNVGHKTEVTKDIKHEKREKHKSKHSSKDKSISNHTEHSNPSIKVKIRKDIINLPEKSQKSSSSTSDNVKKSLKIKLPKPPVPDSASASASTSIKLVITKDKSGSGSYCTSHKNERESKKRSHSPGSRDLNYKSYGEASSKYAKLEQVHNLHSGAKQNKSRHSSNRNVDHASNSLKNQHLGNSYSYLNVDVETYGSQPYYNNQYFPYQITPPTGHRGKTNSNPPLPPPLPPQPPPPPPPE